MVKFEEGADPTPARDPLCKTDPLASCGNILLSFFVNHNLDTRKLLSALRKVILFYFKNLCLF